MFVAEFEKKYGYKPEWGADNCYMQFAHWARMVENAGTFYPPAVIKTYENGQTIQSLVGDVYYRPEDHQLRPPGDHRAGQDAEGHEGQGRLLRRRRGRSRASR